MKKEIADKAARKIANAILRSQDGFATFFGRKTAGFGKKGNTIFLIGVCVVFGGLSISSLLTVFMKEKSIVTKPEQMIVPGHFDKTGEPGIDKVVAVSPSLYERLQAFRGYMDSLRRSPAGRLQYDSILLDRPGLMDSV